LVAGRRTAAGSGLGHVGADMRIELVEGRPTSLVEGRMAALAAGTGTALGGDRGTARRDMNRSVAVGRDSGVREGIAAGVLRRGRVSGSREAGCCRGSRPGCPS